MAGGELGERLRHLPEHLHPRAVVLAAGAEVEGDRVEDEQLHRRPLAHEGVELADARELLVGVVDAEDVDPPEQRLHVAELLERRAVQRVLVALRRPLQVREQRGGDRVAALGEERALGVDVHRLALGAAHHARDLHVHRELHPELRLADPGHARELGELRRGDAAAEQRVEPLDERDDARRPPLLLEQLEARARRPLRRPARRAAHLEQQRARLLLRRAQLGRQLGRAEPTRSDATTKRTSRGA